MDVPPSLRAAGRWLAGAGVLAAAAYATHAAVTWFRYGRAARAAEAEDEDQLLDLFMPAYDVVERHRLLVAAPAEVTLRAAAEIDLGASPIVRAIFKGRELILGASPDEASRPRALLAQMTSLGWTVLAEIPGRELVLGAAAQPWLADVSFRPVPPEEFADFDEPGYVKIAWTLRAEPLGAHASWARTETRAVATDAASRSRFRRYWSFFSPGIVLIRRESLRLVRKEAEGRARLAAPHGEPATFSPSAR